MTPLPATLHAVPRRELPSEPPHAPLGPPPRRGLTPGLLLKASVGVLVAVLVALPIALGMAVAMAASVACEVVRGLVVRPDRSGPTRR